MGRSKSFEMIAWMLRGWKACAVRANSDGERASHDAGAEAHPIAPTCSLTHREKRDGQNQLEERSISRRLAEVVPGIGKLSRDR